MTGITLDHLIGRLKAGIGDLSHAQLLVVSLLRRDDGSVGHEREVDARVGHQVGLELRQVHVQGAVEPQRGGDRGHDLRDQSVQVCVGRTLNVQVPE